MAWQTPKTDWTAPDGVRNTDFNRIEGNILELYNESLRDSKIIYVATTGNDETGQGTSAAPYKTITKALSEVPTDLKGNSINIHISSGTYDEAITVKGISGGVLGFTGNASRVEMRSLTVNGCALNISSLTPVVTAAVGISVTNGGMLLTTGNIDTESASTGVNIGNCSRMHVLGTLSCSAAANAVTCSGNSMLYANAITGIGLLNATMGATIAFNTSSLSRSTATGGRINTGSQGTGFGGLAETSLE